MNDRDMTSKVDQALANMDRAWGQLGRAHRQRASSVSLALDPRRSHELEALESNLAQAMRAVGQAILEARLAGYELDLVPGDGDRREPSEGGVTGAGPVREPLAPEIVREELDIFLEECATAPTFEDTADAVDEMQRLDEWSSEERLESMEEWPDRARVLYVEIVAARARALQDADRDVLTLIDTGRIAVFFGRLSEHLKVGWPGRAHGLARAHTPRSYSWADDAIELHEELELYVEREFASEE